MKGSHDRFADKTAILGYGWAAAAGRRAAEAVQRGERRMSIAFQCEHCGKHYEVGDELAMRRARCSGCQAVFRVPEPASMLHLPLGDEALLAATVALPVHVALTCVASKLATGAKTDSVCCCLLFVVS